MDKYRVILNWDEADNIFVAKIPELEGANAWGKTRAEAMKNIEEVVEMYLETKKELGEVVPQPLSEKDFSGTVNLRMGKDRHQTAAIQAAAAGISLNEYIVGLIDKDEQKDEFEEKLSATAKFIEGVFAGPIKSNARLNSEAIHKLSAYVGKNVKVVAGEVKTVTKEQAEKLLKSMKDVDRDEVIRKLWSATKRQHLSEPRPRKEKVVVSAGLLKHNKSRSILTSTKHKKK